jgi:hypothetical protein
MCPLLGSLLRNVAGDAASDVLTVRNGLKMSWVNAGDVAAKMVQHQPFGDRANQVLVEIAMCPIMSAIRPYNNVAVR